jgi:hypothetical protein
MASQNVVAVVVLLSTMPTPLTDGVDNVYQQLKDILGTTAAQQVQSSLLRRAETSLLTPNCSKAGWQKATQSPPVA